ncbi:hypothetical protein FNV43_RR06029 [Rhamnella rubrinervis]|uniref:DUF4283 domain-containing protein n=1 Tax=Rhamnella rubrinervis TaxID=2594499 RepID=A0A8K0HCU5_9ROSA|nr:hypothetical protein FNV43_RR06029 [Rhamnella rubrinervis]
MDPQQPRAVQLQLSFQGLSLTDREEEASEITRKVLMGKLLSTRSFRRFKLADFIPKIWNLQGKVRIENVLDNVFKFSFSEYKDKEAIFNRRPWSFNGAHMIMKEWSPDLQLKEIDFSTSIFQVQIHELPPKLFHLENAVKIEGLLGKVYKESIHKRALVGGKYIRLKVEISIGQPITAGFFQHRDDREDFWVQFKYKRLSDFCYTCGMIDHVIGRCTFRNPATVTAANGVTAQLYGRWIRAESSESMIFESKVRTAPIQVTENNDRQEGEAIEAIQTDEDSRIEEEVSTIKHLDPVGISIARGSIEKSRDIRDSKIREPNVNALCITLGRQLDTDLCLRSSIIQQGLTKNFTIEKLEEWASSWIAQFANLAVQKDNNLERSLSEIQSNVGRNLGKELLSWAGITPGATSPASGNRTRPISIPSMIQRKRTGSQLEGGKIIGGVFNESSSRVDEEELSRAFEEEASIREESALSPFEMGRKSISPIRTRSRRRQL